MPLISGMAGSFGFAAETQWALPVTPTRFVPMLEESLQTEVERLESESIIAGQRILRSSQWTPALRRSEGDISLELFDGSLGMLFTHVLGSVSSTGTNPATHTFTVGDLQGKGLTLQFGRPARSGTVVPFTYAGGKVQSMEVGLATGEIATLGLTVVARTETTGIVLATPTYNPAIRPLNFVFGSLSLAGSSLCVRGATISFERELDTDRVCLGSDVIDEPAEAGLVEATAELEIEFGDQGEGDLDLYSKYLSGEESRLDLTVRNSTSTAAIRFIGNVRYDGETPNVGGRDIITHSLTAKYVGTSNDTGAFTVVYTNFDATP